MEVNTSLWGTIPATNQGDPLRDLSELEMEVVTLALETKPHDSASEDDKWSAESEFESLKLVPGECSQMDPIILNTIQLLQYSKHVGELTDRIYSKTENLSGEIEKLKPIPKLLKINSKNAHLPPDYESEFVSGIGPKPCPLSSRVRNQILFKSVGTLAAHAGYDTSSSEALEVLTSVTGDLITKICRLFKLTVDTQSSSTTPVDYLKCLEKVFHDMSLGTLRSLRYFYQSRILDYRKSARLNCERLVEELQIANATAISILLKQEQLKNESRYEMEFKQDDDDIPQLHFPASEDGTENDEFQSSLEPGFQMLHNLEQEQLQMENADLERNANLVIHHQASTKFIARK